MAGKQHSKTIETVEMEDCYCILNMSNCADLPVHHFAPHRLTFLLYTLLSLFSLSHCPDAASTWSGVCSGISETVYFR